MEDTRIANKPSNWKASLVQFSNTTTFHGLRYIVLSRSLGRRLMWIMTVVACICAVGYQIVDRVMFFYAWPVNVNVKINYNQTLVFPAVTICNQNAFKATEAARYGYYELIEDMFSKSTNFSVESIKRYGASDVTLEELYVNLRHTKEDLIVKCRWNGHECGPDSFDTILTDHGLCYKFTEKSTDMMVSSSGVDSGLRLTLNVEQYEYMAGPHGAAGVKILLHEPRETPSVHGLGQAVATGTHAFVGVKYMMINNLPEPHGDCYYRTLKHTSYYTTEECYMDCLTKLSAKICGCRNTYMPSVIVPTTVCTLEAYYSCLKQLEDEFDEVYAQKCNCPVPCEFFLFEPAFSYATISNHVVRKLLTSNESRALKAKLLLASETTSRMDKNNMEEFKVLVDALNDRFTSLKLVLKRVSNYLMNQTLELSNVLNETTSAFNEKERLYRFQAYTVEKNFLRGREAMEERTLANLALGFAEFAMVNARRIRRLVTIPENETASRRDLYELIIDAFKVRQELAALARENISVLYTAFVNGTQIFNYSFEGTSRSHNAYIVPKPLLNESMYHNSYVRRHGPKLLRDFDLMETVLDMFMEEATIAYFNSTINETRLNYTFERYLYACRTYMFSKSVIYSQGIDRPVAIINDRRNQFVKHWDDFSARFGEMEQNLKALTLGLEKIESVYISKLSALVDKLVVYVNRKNESLMALADAILSEDTQEVLSSIKDFFLEIENRGQSIYDSWTLLIDPIQSLWTMILEDEDLKEYYEFTNNTRFLQNATEVIDGYICACTTVREDLDVRDAVQNKDEEFFTATAEITTHLADFKSSIKIDHSFLRENFLQLDIFFRQLSYEHIMQQKAYDIFALICDIGGSMGLFIGASMLTIVEIIDLVLSQTPIFAMEEDHKRKLAAY